MNQGKTLTLLGFLDIIYCPWTDFIFPGRDLFDVYTLGFELKSDSVIFNGSFSHSKPLIF